jgi:hypothetical protein
MTNAERAQWMKITKTRQRKILRGEFNVIPSMKPSAPSPSFPPNRYDGVTMHAVNDSTPISPTDNPVDSSFIASIGYEPNGSGSGDAVVNMKAGRSYVYQGMAEHVFQQWLKEESKGKFFNASVKYNYTWHKIRG